MMSLSRLFAEEDARIAAVAPAVAVEAPAPAVRVNALDWCNAILGRYADVADARQVDHARYLLSDESLSGLMITPIGADFAELDTRLAAEAEAPAPSPAPADVEAAPTLVLTIKGTAYDVAPLDAGECGSRAFRLTKADGAAYDVVRTAHTVECDCGDYEFRHRGTAGLCKHGRALVALGLVEAPAEAPPAAFVEAVREAIGDPADLGPEGPVSLEEYLATVGADVPTDGFADELLREVGPEPLDAPAEDPLAAVGPDGHLFARPARTFLRAAEGPALAPVRPLPLPDGRYDLAGLVAGQAAFLRGQGSAPFALMAAALDRLAADIRATGATSVIDFEGRIAEMEADRDARLREEGYAAGRDACPCSLAVA